MFLRENSECRRLSIVLKMLYKKESTKNYSKFEPKEMQFTIMSAFTVVAITLMFAMGFIMYFSFARISKSDTIQNILDMVEQTSDNLESYLISMRQISDATYYNIIKESSMSDPAVQNSLNVVYEANKDSLRTVAIYNENGSLLMAEPVALQKDNLNVSRQDWFLSAMSVPENMHFSVPHIQDLFDDSTKRYYWVISLSRVIEITDNNMSRRGVLLVDMDYSSVSRIMEQVNKGNTGKYFYLCDGDGKIIYHPRQVQIERGMSSENNVVAASYTEGAHEEVFDGEIRSVVVNTISYTGWKLVGVIPGDTFSKSMSNIRNFIVILILVMMMMLLIINRLVSGRIVAVAKIVRDQNERRKSEIDALQSQINPHFLYNTLDSIIWMVEGERNNDAVYMISQLAKLFRISLSKGKTVITLKDEMLHAVSYLNIQKVRYKDSFSVEYDIDSQLENMCTVKLILQPILENAIYYGMDGMDGDGLITIRVKSMQKDILITIEDNGIGMPAEVADNLLTDKNREHAKGSGVGLINVDNRIKIMFGEKYGLKIDSEPDEGTRVYIRIPAIPFTEETRDNLEGGLLEADDEN